MIPTDNILRTLRTGWSKNLRDLRGLTSPSILKSPYRTPSKRLFLYQVPVPFFMTMNSYLFFDTY